MTNNQILVQNIETFATITRLISGPAAQMGMIKEVKIVDMMDCIVFLARDNKIVFPPNPAEKAEK